MEDTIYKGMAINVIEKRKEHIRAHLDKDVADAICTILDSVSSDIFDLPSAQPERKKGKWEEVQFRTIPYNRISKAKKCSVCGKRKDKYVTWNFCPNCGADMRGESE